MSINRSLPPVDDYVRERCHYRHMWDYVDSNHWTARMGEPLTLRCMRCLAEFRAQIAANGEYARKPDYVYPPSYQYSGDEHRLSTKERRSLLVQTSILEARKTRISNTERAQAS